MNLSKINEGTDLQTHLNSLVWNADIEWKVAEEALHYENPCEFFQDLAENGCVSGMVGSLIYCTDTAAFFDAHYDEIETLRLEIEDETGVPLQIHGDLKNFLSWFAFEEVAYRIAEKWELY